MVVIHNNKAIGVNVASVSKITEKDFIRINKPVDIFSEKELGEIYRIVTGKSKVVEDELK